MSDVRRAAAGALLDWTPKGAHSEPSDRRLWLVRDDGSFTIRGLLGEGPREELDVALISREPIAEELGKLR